MLRDPGDIQDPGRSGVRDGGTPGGRTRYVGKDDQSGARRVLYSYSEAAQMCGVGVRTIQRLIADGTLPRHAVLNRIPGTALNRFLKNIQYESKKKKVSSPDT